MPTYAGTVAWGPKTTGGGGLRLVAIDGPTRDHHVLGPPKTAWTLGRATTADVRLDDAAVSRQHARITHAKDHHTIEDLSSHNGTYLNGKRIEGGKPVPLSAGAMLGIGPWLFVVRAHSDATSSRHSSFGAEGGMLSVAPVAMDARSAISGRRLELLMEASSGVSLALSEEAAATVALRAMILGSGARSGAIVHAIRDSFANSVEVVAKADARGEPTVREVPLSRTLVLAAGDGRPVRLARAQVASETSTSIIGSGLEDAIAVPIKIDGRIDRCAFLALPLQEKGGDPTLEAFVLSVVQMLGSGLSALRSREASKEWELARASLEQAREVQRRILPAPSGRSGKFQHAFFFQAHNHVAGDLAGVVPMPDGRVACFVGDATGGGPGPGLLMSAAHTALTTRLESGRTLAEVMRATNRQVSALTEPCVFVTLFCAVIDPVKRTLTCCDAGHGYAAVVGPDGACKWIESEGGPPLGIDPDYEYHETTLTLESGSRVLLISDGVVEQACTNGEQFGKDGVTKAVQRAATPQAIVDAVMASLSHAANRTEYVDDLTILAGAWD